MLRNGRSTDGCGCRTFTPRYNLAATNHCRHYLQLRSAGQTRNQVFLLKSVTDWDKIRFPSNLGGEHWRPRNLSSGWEEVQPTHILGGTWSFEARSQARLEAPDLVRKRRRYSRNLEIKLQVLATLTLAEPERAKNTSWLEHIIYNPQN